jgi:ornithine cyclodeaminase/alanine dehydrogenase-like protein (mu-crystallin family)
MTAATAAPPAPVVILSRSDVAALMTPADYLEAVEAGFRGLHEGAAQMPPPWHIDGDGGGFHGKGASLRAEKLYVALKLNGNFPGNRASSGLPTVQGAILLFDGETGSALAIMDSIEVTLRRTAAATALAARYLARPDAATVLVCGCGEQAAAQLDALREVLPLTRAFAWDRDRSRAEQLSSGLLEMHVADDLSEAARCSDVIVTCTSATEPFLSAGMVRPGTFIAAVGADAPHKKEIHPDLMAAAQIVADSLDQCAVMGDLHHAIEAGTMDRADVHAELAELVVKAKPGRIDDAKITLFDSTGTAVQDVAAAIRLYQRAVESDCGTRTTLAG